MRGGPIITSPLVNGDYLYALVDLGILRCFHARTGELLYQERLPDSFLSSPVAAGGKVYLASETGHVYVVRAGPSYELLAVNDMGEPIVATPAISDGVLYLRTLRHLYAVDDRGRQQKRP
jgi:outer membrane protein assembly factor BamB